jgi:hypothetical protein
MRLGRATPRRVERFTGARQIQKLPVEVDDPNDARRLLENTIGERSKRIAS